MITAHVNEMGIVMVFGAMQDNFSHDEWEKLLDELKSHYIPSFYQYGKRLHIDFGGAQGDRTGLMRAVIYFTPDTATIEQAISILKKRHMEVTDGRVFPPEVL